jgi:hypothetical protein
MDKLVEPIVSVLEMLVLGAIALIFSVYVTMFWHPCKRVLTDYIGGLSKYVFGDEVTPDRAEQQSGHADTTTAEVRHWLKLGVLLGVVYYAGVLANGAAYDVLQHAHVDVIAHVQPDSSGLPMIDDSECFCLWPRLFERVDGEAERKHGDSVYREMEWRNINPDAASHELDRLQKHVQLLRGTVLIAACFGFVAFLKAGVAAATWVLLWSKPLRRVGKCLYRNFIDDHNHWLTGKPNVQPKTTTDLSRGSRLSDTEFESEDDFKARRSITGTKVLGPNVLICFIAGAIYVIAMSTWRTTEFEYHAIVLAGQETAVKTLAAGGSRSGPPEFRKVGH